MSDLAISALPIAGAISGSELIPLVQTGTTCQSTASALLTYISGSLTATNGLTKTGNNIVWGGALTGNTSISGSYTINFSNSFVGINTATQSGASERLRVNGPARFDDTVYVSDQGYFTWSPGTSFSIVATSQHLYLATGAAKDIVFLNNGTESARIFSDNNVSIGYGVSASARLQTVGSTTDSSAYAFKVFDSALSQIIAVRNDGYTYFSRLTATTVPYIDASNRLVSSAVTPTELGYLSGATSNIQTQLNNLGTAIIFPQYGGTGIANNSASTITISGAYASTFSISGAYTYTFPTATSTLLANNLGLSGGSTLVGGTAVGDALNLKGTSGNGTSTVAAINFLVGNNGATTAGSVYNSGQVNIGNYASPTNLRIFTVGQDTAFMSFGSLVGATNYAAIYFNQSTPSSSNFAISGDATTTYISSTSTTYINVNGATKAYFQPNLMAFQASVASSGAVTTFTFTGSANTGQTASTEINRFLLTTSSRQWATGAITTQREVYITSPTYSFVGASTISSAYTLYVEAPTAGTNATITNKYSIGANGKIQATGYDMNAYGYVMTKAGIGIISNQFSSNGGFSIASQTLALPVGILVGGTDGAEVARFSGQTTTGATNQIVFSGSSTTGQTNLTEINGVLFNSYSRAWAAGIGTITTQREYYVKTVTYTQATNALTITNAYGMYVEAPTASTNITITNNFALGLNGSLKINDAFNIVFDTTTGTKIGTGTTQKIGFWNATPIVQPTTAVAAATFVANTSGIVDDTATFDGYTIGQVVKALRNTGILA